MMTTRFTRRRETSIALLTVLLAIILLDLIISEVALYSYDAITETRNYTQDVQHCASTDGVIRMANVLLFDPNLTPDQLLGLLNDGISAFSMGDNQVDVAFEEESGKLNICRLADDNQLIRDEARKELSALFSNLNLDTGVADKISDMVSKMQTGDPSTSTVPLVIEELRALPEVTEQMLYGRTDTDAAVRGLASYITVTGDGRLNVNTARPETLRAVVGDSNAVEFLLSRRAQTPFASILDAISGMRLSPAESNRLMQRLGVDNQAYTVKVRSFQGARISVSSALIAESGGEGVVRFCRREH